MNKEEKTFGLKKETFHTILTEKVVITEDHWDRDISNTDGIKESIEEHGIIQPIVLTDPTKNELVDGFRRLTYAKELGLTKVPCHYYGELDQYTRKTLELETNIRRKDLSWSEKDLQTDELHQLKIQKHGKKEKGKYADQEKGWGIKETANTINVTKGNVSRSIKLAEENRKDPSLAEESSRSASQKRRTLSYTS